ncbi:hypothetical protein OS493_021197 [Desmophyllum pertusum]|uniref:Alcohol dehydrogenase-like C-terminal domain-containing protein n=1 Tax=Desmophyllum pertusum TaxID=174260 RepID=A0A9X0D2V2_9CNID|nr:hypothetical protein OS493_021197 [Desmophyllum pertusum]
MWVRFAYNQWKKKRSDPSILGHEGVIEVWSASPMTEDSSIEWVLRVPIIIHSGTHVVKIPDHVNDKIASPVNCAKMLQPWVNAVSGLDGKILIVTQLLLFRVVVFWVFMVVHFFMKLASAEFSVQTLISRDWKWFQKFGGIPVVTGEHTSSGLHGNSVDVIIEVCGVPSVIPEGIKLLRAGGVYVFVGMVHPASKLDITGEQIIRKCITIKGIHNYGPQHLDEAVAFLSRTCTRYPYNELFSPTFKLADFETALQLSKQQSFYRVCVEP